eukprot:scaffold599517_cov48-Prasinocladus_malaysianus.AAC.1
MPCCIIEYDVWPDICKDGAKECIQPNKELGDAAQNKIAGEAKVEASETACAGEKACNCSESTAHDGEAADDEFQPEASKSPRLVANSTTASSLFKVGTDDICRVPAYLICCNSFGSRAANQDLR